MGSAWNDKYAKPLESVLEVYVCPLKLKTISWLDNALLLDLRYADNTLFSPYWQVKSFTVKLVGILLTVTVTVFLLVT